MGKRFWGIFGKWAGHAQTIAGYLPGPVLAFITWTVGMIAQINPFWLWMGVIVSAFVGHFGWIQLNGKTYARIFVLSIMLLAISSLSLAVYQNHQRHNNYTVELDEWTLMRKARPISSNDAVVYVVQMRLCFKNSNDFPVFAQLTRNYLSLAQRTSGDMDNLNGEVMRMVPGKCLLIDHDPISVPDLPTGRHHQGEMIFELDYGRAPDQLDKNLVVKRHLEVAFCPPTAAVCDLVLR